MMTLGFLFASGSAFAQTAGPTIAAKLITKVPFIIKKPGLYLLKKDLVFTPTIGATGNAITINAVVPHSEDEMNLKLRAGTDELLKRYDNHGVSDIVDLRRRDAAAKRFGLW